MNIKNLNIISNMALCAAIDSVLDDHVTGYSDLAVVLLTVADVWCKRHDVPVNKVLDLISETVETRNRFESMTANIGKDVKSGSDDRQDTSVVDKFESGSDFDQFLKSWLDAEV